MNKGYFIVCEGLDCSGKTTSIENALEHFKKNEFSIEYNKGLKTKTLAGTFSRKFPSTLSLLTELLYNDVILVKSRLEKGINILQDRWYYSVLSYNPENRKDKHLEKVFVPLLSKPDVLIYFTVSLDERIRRLKKSIENKDHYTLLKNPEIIKQREERYLDYFNNFKGNKAIINTKNLSEKQSGVRLYDLINYYLAKQ